MALFEDVVKQSPGAEQAQVPIPLEYLYRGLASQEATTQKNLSEVQQEIGNVWNLPTLPGADTEVMNKAKQQLQESLKGVSTGDLTNPQNVSKINSIITQITQNPDVQAVVGRGTQFAKMKKEKETAEAAGKEYISPGWDDAINYLNQGKYIRNKQFNSDGWIDPNITKLINEGLKNAVSTKNVYDPQSGTWYPVEYIDQDKARMVVDNILNTTPNARKTFDYNLEKQLQGTDWDNSYQGRLDDDLSQNRQLIQNAAHRLAISTDPAEKEMINNELQQHISYNTKLLNMKNLQGGNIVKSQYKDYLEQKQLNDYIDAYTHIKEGKRELDKRTEIALQKSADLENKMAEEEFKAAADAGKVKFITDDKGNVHGWRYPLNGEQSDITSKEEQKIAEERAGAEAKVAAKVSQSGGSAGYKTSDPIEVVGKTTTYGKYAEGIFKGDPSTVYEYLKANPHAFDAYGLTENEVEKIKKPGDIDFDGVNNYTIAGHDISAGAIERTITSSAKRVSAPKEEIPTPENYRHAAKLGSDTIYSNNGTVWYNKQGQKVQ